MKKQYLIVAIVLLIVYYFFFARGVRAATMQNDTESIALPSTVTDGQQTIIYDNPDLITQWAEGSNDPYADFLAAVVLTLTPDADGSVTVTVSDDDDGATVAALVDALGSDSGFTYTPVTTGGVTAGTGGTGGSIVISGSKLRQALKEKGILTIVVKGWDFDDSSYIDDSEYYLHEASLDYSDVAVIAAAAVFRDQNIEEVSLVGNRLNISYRTKGWLFGLIPVHFTVYLSINASGTTDTERVSVKFPWYRFFTWLSLSPVGLAADLNAAIIGNQAAGLDPADSQARLFSHITSILRTQNATDVQGI